VLPIRQRATVMRCGDLAHVIWDQNCVGVHSGCMAPTPGVSARGARGRFCSLLGIAAKARPRARGNSFPPMERIAFTHSYKGLRVRVPHYVRADTHSRQSGSLVRVWVAGQGSHDDAGVPSSSRGDARRCVSDTGPAMEERTSGARDIRSLYSTRDSHQ